MRKLAWFAASCSAAVFLAGYVLPEGALVLELASAPGGTDFDAARAFGIRALTAPGLPGKWSPDAAAAAVRDALYRCMEDE